HRHGDDRLHQARPLVALAIRCLGGQGLADDALYMRAGKREVMTDGRADLIQVLDDDPAALAGAETAHRGDGRAVVQIMQRADAVPEVAAAAHLERDLPFFERGLEIEPDGSRAIEDGDLSGGLALTQELGDRGGHLPGLDLGRGITADDDLARLSEDGPVVLI